MKSFIVLEAAKLWPFDVIVFVCERDLDTQLVCEVVAMGHGVS